eukprot:maker-scaffold14_size734282-snap-gene-2.24 protein:Tk11291 transcript:maker-scaffold14_size734282-snap-gene-2.24-mRNA-1 annotation:"piwi-like protein 1"
MSGRGRGANLLAKLQAIAQQKEEETTTVDSELTSISTKSQDTAPTTSSAPTSGPAESGFHSDKGSTLDGSSRPNSARGRSSLLASLAARRSTVAQLRPPGTSELPLPAATVAATSAPPKVEERMASLQVSEAEGEPVIRRGQAGQTTTCSANHVVLKFPSDKGVFEYEVRFNPQLDAMRERHRALASILTVLGKTKTFDGVKLFLPKRLPEQTTVISTVTSSGLEVEITILFKCWKNLGDRDCVFLYNILMRRVMESLKFLEVWPGFETAINEYEGGLQLQIDVSHRVLRKETAYDAIKAIAARKGDIKNEAEKGLLGATILTRYNNKTYRIDDIDWVANPLSTFTDSKGGEISYVEYYKKQYGIEILDQKQPLLINHPKTKAQGESQVTKLICLVPELCNLTGLTDSMRSNFNLMREVATHTRIDPLQRQKTLKEFIQKVKSTPEAKEILANWGMEMDDSSIELQGRVIDPERIHFAKVTERVGPTADWTRSATSTLVLTPINVESWDLIFPQTMGAVAKKFAETLQSQASRMGIKVAMARPKSLGNDRTEGYLNAIRAAVDAKTQLVVCIFSQQRADKYAAVKKLCYIERPVASQVVLQRTISNDKRLASVVQKIALQINCKLGGELWATPSPFPNAMVVGMDVYHDPGQRGQSIAGVVTSLNQRYSRWFSTTCHQRPQQELVDALKIAFIAGLRRYYQDNNQWPAQVIVFRDGVGDSQIEFTKQHEVRQLKECFSQCYTGYEPAFVFVVVQKRINTRIYMSKMGVVSNPAPGTIVDHTITRRNFYDFFLVSQKVGQGTVSPTHYVVIEEQNSEQLSPDVIQKMAYKLTHMYYNWPGTIRVPAPCQYAHKLAAMTGEHLKKEPSSMLADKLFYL